MQSRGESGAGMVKKAAHHAYVATRITPNFDTSPEMDCFIRLRGKLISGKQLARDCLAAWERILAAAYIGSTVQIIDLARAAQLSRGHFFQAFR